jgi:putative flippase GtrA
MWTAIAAGTQVPSTSGVTTASWRRRIVWAYVANDGITFGDNRTSRQW